MKKSLVYVFLLLGFPIFLCKAQSDEKPYLTKQFQMGNSGKLEAETSGGNIAVLGQKSGQAKVEVYVRGNNGKAKLSADEIKERLENYEITINQEGNTLYAKSRSKKNFSSWVVNNGLSISFKIYVPEKVASRLQTSGGNIAIADVAGEQQVSTSGGNISVDNVNGNTALETSGGNINVDNYKGRLTVECSGGNIKLSNASGELKVETSGGNISLSEVSGGVEAETSGGNISAKLSQIDKFLTLETSGGNISANIPMDKGLDIDIEADKVHANIKNWNFSGKIDKDVIKGSVNGGGIPVKIRTSGGNVNLN